MAFGQDSGVQAAGKEAKRAVTRELAHFAVHSSFSKLPENVQTEAGRAFLNWLGCAYGGCGEPAVAIACATVAATGAAPQASVIGHSLRTDVASAAFINCISSSVHGFDDADLATVTHPSSPVASALLAFSENTRVSGTDFLEAIALGIEITCRISNALLLPPSTFDEGFYITGLSAPIGTAVAIGKLLKLDEQKMNWAIGIAASQGAGFRASHGTMTAGFRSGHATRCGVWAAQLAAGGYQCSEQSLEGAKGFFDVYSSGADLNRAADGLGQTFDMFQNAYKPYPAGIVTHPTIDACLEIKEQLGPDAEIAKVTLRVHPMTLFLADKRTPRDRMEAVVSIFHWAAAVLLRGRAGLAESQQDCLDHPEVAALRARIEAIADTQIRKDESVVEVVRADGVTFRSHVVNARGSLARPMTDDELDEKFRAQVNTVLPAAATERLLRLSRNLASLGDVGGSVSAAWRP